MKRKKKFGTKPVPHGGRRNAAPSAPRAPRNAVRAESALMRLGYTAAGAAGTALLGSFLAHEGWAPKTIATALAAVGAGLAWKGDQESIRSVGAGAMSAAGSQLALMLMDDHDKAPNASSTTSAATSASTAAPNAQLPKPANAGELPPGALESAFERAKARLAIASPQVVEVDA